MPNAEKTEKVTALKERIEGSTALLLAEYRGLTVHDATELRRSLAEDARFAVVKNTLMALAATEAGIEDLEAMLAGPTAVAFVDGDVVAAAKRVVDASKKFPALVLKGGYMDGRVLSAADAQSLATLESREVMLSKIAGLLKGEMTRAASMFQAVQSRFLGVLEAYKEKVPGEPEPEAPAADTEASAADTEAPASAEPAEAATVDADEGQPVEDSAEAPEADASDAEAPAAEAAAEGANDADAAEPAAEANTTDETSASEDATQTEEG
jgi:large subunit ribosomal protein L10